MRVALVHDWLVSQRGGEHVLKEIAALYPDAPIYTLVHVPTTVDGALERHTIIRSFIQDLPGAPEHFRRYLPLFPRAVEAWDLGEYDLVISTSHCVAKGALSRPEALHISYMHTPMRYVWDQWPQYFGSSSKPFRLVAAPLLNYMRTWDVASSARVIVSLS